MNNLSKRLWFYYMKDELLYEPSIGNYLSYRLDIFDSANQGIAPIMQIHDITTDHLFAEAIAKKLFNCQVSPIHLKDVIEDIIP